MRDLSSELLAKVMESRVKRESLLAISRFNKITNTIAATSPKYAQPINIVCDKLIYRGRHCE